MSKKTFERRVSVDADYKGQGEWEEYWYGDWVTRHEEEDARAYDRLRIPPRKLSWARNNKFFGQRKKRPHGWHSHPRRKRLTARRKPQAREINRQYRPFGKRVCKEAWRRDAASQYRRLLLEARPDLKPLWRVVDSDDEPLSEVKRKMELEKLVEEELVHRISTFFCLWLPSSSVEVFCFCLLASSR